MKKKILVFILVSLLFAGQVFVCLPKEASASEGAAKSGRELNISDVSGYLITVTRDGDRVMYSVNSGPASDEEIVIYGTGANCYVIINFSDSSGIDAKITLKNLSIDNRHTNYSPVSISGTGNVTIELEGTNQLIAADDKAAIQTEQTGTLTIQNKAGKEGKLVAQGGANAAGIGGGNGGNGENIIIKSGTIEATGGQYGAGIGGGNGGDGKNITIQGGEVTANGGRNGAGIGGGNDGDGKNITIQGGTVTAEGGNYGAGIGGGDRGSGSGITIGSAENATGKTKVTAEGGNYGAGIGGGFRGHGSIIIIEGNADVTATGGEWGAGIGGGDEGNGSEITIKGNATVTAEGGKYGAGIGGGEYMDTGGSGSNISIEDNASVTASGGNGGAGIGGGYNGDGSRITIKGDANVTATGGNGGAGIGGGMRISDAGGLGSIITICNNAVVYATGTGLGAGIGGGYRGDCSGIIITGNANVKAAGGERSFYHGAAIGQGAQCTNEIFNGAESIITVIATIEGKEYEWTGEVRRFPAGTSVKEMTEGTVSGTQVTEATITFAAIGGQKEPKTQVLTPGWNTFPEDLFKLEGYGIAWNTDANGNGDSYISGNKVTFIGETTLYAQYKELHEITVVGGSTRESPSIEGTIVTVRASDPYEGEVFVGWEMNDEVVFNNPYDPVTTFVMPDKEVTVKAVFWDITISGLKTSYDYTVGGIKPDITIELEGLDEDIWKDWECEVTYKNNDKPGKASVIVTFPRMIEGESTPYVGSKTVDFTITGNTVRWLNGDGTVLEEAYYTDAMGMPSYSKNVTPTGKEQAGHIITFIGWDNGTELTNEYGKVTTYKPLFSDEKITYKVTFVDEDDTELQSSTVAYGEKPEYKGKKPTGAADVVCSAEFAGWDKEIVTVTGDATYKATYKKYNEHDYQPVAGTAVAPTCTKAGKEADTKCSRCGDVITGKEIVATGHTFNQEVVDAKYLKSAADCITAAVYFKSCKCGEKSTDEKDIFTSGEPAGHKWKAATGYAPKTCEVCGLEEGQKVTYDPIKGQVFVWTKGSKEPFILTIKRSQDDVNCFLHYLNTLLDGAEIKVEARSGSTIITIPAETLEKLAVGEHKITVVFDDWKADFALSIAAAPADTTPVTGDTMPVVPIAVVMVVAFGAAGIAMRRKTRMNRM